MNKHIGSSIDSFLKEERINAEVDVKTRNSLTLVNESPGQLILSLAKVRFLKRGRRHMMTLKIEPKCTVELCAELEIDKAEALEIVENSADITAMREKGLLTVIDTDAEADARTVEEAARRLSTHKKDGRLEWLVDTARKMERAGVSPDYEAHKALLDDVIVKSLSAEGKKHRERNEVRREELGNELGNDVERSTTSSTNITSDALDPSIREALTDNTPSSKWTRDRLMEHAKSKGIEVRDGDSKNRILRKLRGM